jgi:hypothetical protein
MNIRADGVAEIDAFGPRPSIDVISALRTGKLAAVRVYNLVSIAVCQVLTERLLASHTIIDHTDVEGLRVIGLSHFQAVRTPELAEHYLSEAQTSAGALRALAWPYASPFDSAVALLAQWWPAGCQIMKLPTEGILSPFTVRIYYHGVGIDPHQDKLSAESPNDPAAGSLIDQFGANLYFSMPTLGGSLEIFDADVSATNYVNLEQGPQIIPRDSLPAPSVTIKPSTGDLIIFSSRHIHAVTASEGEGLRITVSFFVGIQDAQSQLKIWA